MKKLKRKLVLTEEEVTMILNLMTYYKEIHKNPDNKSTAAEIHGKMLYLLNFLFHTSNF